MRDTGRSVVGTLAEKEQVSARQIEHAVEAAEHYGRVRRMRAVADYRGLWKEYDEAMADGG